jgi:hypothetical protein
LARVESLTTELNKKKPAMVIEVLSGQKLFGSVLP